MRAHKSVTRILLAFLLWAAAFGFAQAQGEPVAVYLEATKLFRQGKYQPACEAFEQFLAQHPDSRFAPDAAFKIGESLYRQEQHEKAGGYYRLYTERFSLGRNAGDARYRLAQCEAKVGHRIRAAQPRMKFNHGPLRAVRVDRFAQTSWPELDRDLSALPAMGVNALIVPAFHTGPGPPHPLLQADTCTGAYFSTQAAPVCRDMLSRLSTLAHKYNLRVLAQLPVRSLPFGDTDLSWDPLAKATVASGKLDLFSKPDVERALRIVSDLAQVSIDGIVLSGFALTPLEGYSEEAMSLYGESLEQKPDLATLFESVTQSDLGNVKVVPAPTYSQVAKIKSDRLVVVGRLLAEKALAVNPNLEIWVEVSPLAAQDPSEGMLWQSQNIDHLSAAPFTGMFFQVDPQRLFRSKTLTRKERFASIERLLASAALSVKDPSRLLFGLWVEDPLTKKPVLDSQIEPFVRAVRQNQGMGLVAFPMRSGLDYRILFVYPFDKGRSE